MAPPIPPSFLRVSWARPRSRRSAAPPSRRSSLTFRTYVAPKPKAAPTAVVSRPMTTVDTALLHHDCSLLPTARRRSAEDPGVAERVPAGLRPHAQAVRAASDRDPREQ